MNESHLRTLKQISDNLNSSRPNKKNALKILKYLIEKSDSETIRANSIKLLMDIDLKTPIIFGILEKCLLSDESQNVRALAAKILLFDYPKKCKESIRWAIKHDTSPFVLKTINDLSFGMDGHKLELLR
jgi:hypothetical protein